MSFKLSIAQLDMTVGDLSGNAGKITEAAQNAADARVLLTPELSLCGYPPEDLLLMEGFLDQCDEKLRQIRETSRERPELYYLVGHPARKGGKRFNTLSMIRNGAIVASYDKRCLQTQGVFNEKRYFAEGEHPVPVLDIDGRRFGIIFASDVSDEVLCARAKADGAEVLLIADAAPFEEHISEVYAQSIREALASAQLDGVYVTASGAQDSIIFEGGSFVVESGRVTDELPKFDEVQKSVTLGARLGVRLVGDSESATEGDFENAPAGALPKLGDTEKLYKALVTSMRDYVSKNNFKGVVLGLSGGVDSALVLKIAADAIGADKTYAVMMPSVYTSSLSRRDAAQLAKNVGASLSTISIQEGYSAFEFMLARHFDGKPKDTTEENLQARIRGVLLMAISNKFGSMVATTGNKSEMAVGYSTLYGDLAGGFAVLADVYKTQVYELCRYLNAKEAVFPETILTRAPSAELRENQKDQDALPDYGILDAILKRFIEQREDPKTIIEAGFDEAVVLKVVQMVQRAEYKRRQAPIGPKVTKVAFGRDWDFPITNQYRASEC